MDERILHTIPLSYVKFNVKQICIREIYQENKEEKKMHPLGR